MRSLGLGLIWSDFLGLAGDEYPGRLMVHSMDGVGTYMISSSDGRRRFGSDVVLRV